MRADSIKTYPEAILRTGCGLFDPEKTDVSALNRFIDEMIMMMYSSKGIGLAAPQVGVDKQIFVADTGKGPIKIINPVIVKKQGSDKMEEGCLSVPDLSVNVKRSEKIVLKGLNEKLEPVTLELEGLMARVAQHEIDHLNGILIIDYLNPIKKALASRQFKAKRKK
jgi:peptide deformylase